MSTTILRNSDFGNDFEGGFLFTSATAAPTFPPNGQETATLVDASTTRRTPSAIRGLPRTTTAIITIVVTDIITIVWGLWELLNHRSKLTEKTPSIANGGSTFATLTKGGPFNPTETS